MTIEAILNYYIYNGQEYTTDNSMGFEKITSPSVYEVIRIIDGVPLYMEEHLHRMKESAKLLGYSIDKRDKDIYNEIYRLIKINDYPDMNIKLQCSNFKDDNQIFLVYFIKSSYPSGEVYKGGIHTILYNSERENPNAKVINSDLRESINKKLQEEEAFEALLVNESDRITEGSRSNIFFVKEGKVYTAPAGAVLLGITRKKIVNICKGLSIELVEEEVAAKSIKDFDGAFMTGTSVNVLPISSIGHIQYNSVNNLTIKKIGKAYMEDLEGYVKANKRIN